MRVTFRLRPLSVTPMSWVDIPDFPNYAVSDSGLVTNNATGRIMRLTLNQRGIVQVGLMKNHKQYKRSVALLVAQAFLPDPYIGEDSSTPFDTVINLDGDRQNCHASNLAWRPRWFAIFYHQQFNRKVPQILLPIRDINSGLVYETSREAAVRHGLLERDLVLSILNRTWVFPTYQYFEVIEE